MGLLEHARQYVALRSRADDEDMLAAAENIVGARMRVDDSVALHGDDREPGARQDAAFARLPPMSG